MRCSFHSISFHLSPNDTSLSVLPCAAGTAKVSSQLKRKCLHPTVSRFPLQGSVVAFLYGDHLNYSWSSCHLAHSPCSGSRWWSLLPVSDSVFLSNLSSSFAPRCHLLLAGSRPALWCVVTARLLDRRPRRFPFHSSMIRAYRLTPQVGCLPAPPLFEATASSLSCSAQVDGSGINFNENHKSHRWS